MKKLTVYVMSAALLFTSVPMPLKAGTEIIPTSMPANKPVESEEAKVLITRLDEIKAMDKSEMSSTEKKELRKEVNSIQRQLKDIGGGVYLSAGAIIIIILLLILLL